MSIWPVDCFRGTHVLVTGGTSGIGAAIAVAFLADGARVTVTGHSPEECANAPSGCEARLLDVRNGDAVSALFAGLDALHHLVNCAGIIRRGAEHNPEVFADVLAVNLTGTMRACAAARPLLARHGGTIVNTASMLSFFGAALVPGYAASKGGVAQLTKSLAIAYAEEGIRVNAIAPGWIETPLTSALRQDADRNAAIANRTALKRWGRPQELAGAVLFLSSPLASYVTGSILVVDGGYMTV